MSFSSAMQSSFLSPRPHDVLHEPILHLRHQSHLPHTSIRKVQNSLSSHSLPFVFILSLKKPPSPHPNPPPLTHPFTLAKHYDPEIAPSLPRPIIGGGGLEGTSPFVIFFSASLTPPCAKTTGFRAHCNTDPAKHTLAHTRHHTHAATHALQHTFAKTIGSRARGNTRCKTKDATHIATNAATHIVTNDRNKPCNTHCNNDVTHNATDLCENDRL